MKVAILSYDFGEYCVRLASALARLAHVRLLLPQELATPHLACLDPCVDFQPFQKPRLRQAGRQVRLGFRVLQQLKAFEPDVVHVQQGHFWFNGFLPLLRRYPLVLTAHDPRHHVGDRASQKTPQAIVDFGFRRAAHLIVHGTQLKQVLVDRCRIAEDAVHVVPMIALGDTRSSMSSNCHPANDALSSVSHRDRPTILFFGRIWEYKGLEYLIRAEPLITAAVPGARIVIAGEGEDFARYRRMMIRPDHFTVLNEYISEERCAELFRQAHLVVLPYIDASQSAVIPVAYSFMKPVVATTVGGLPELVDDGGTGYLVPPRDEQALAAAIVRLLRDAPLRHQMGLNGKRKLDAQCSPAAVARQTFTVYAHALDDARPCRASASTD